MYWEKEEVGEEAAGITQTVLWMWNMGTSPFADLSLFRQVQHGCVWIWRDTLSFLPSTISRLAQSQMSSSHPRMRRDGEDEERRRGFKGEAEPENKERTDSG